MRARRHQRELRKSFLTLVILIMFFFLSIPAIFAATLPIIPGANGFGIFTAAGSGRHTDPPKTTVYRVTNLNPHGPGSLRQALEAKEPRTIIFEVSGNIDFTPYAVLNIKNPYITIAGQTAPSPGITLKGCELTVNTHDVLIQHIRIRVGDLRDPKRPVVVSKSGWTQWSERDNMKLGGKRIVIDHCSFSWATDENVQSRASQVTFRHNIFSECLNSPKHHKKGHSKGLIILDQSPTNRLVPESERESQYVDVVGNLFAYNADRNPTASGGARVVIVNNLVYGASLRPGIGITLTNSVVRGSRGGGIWATVIGNQFDRVPIPLRLIARPREIRGKIFLKDFLVTYSSDERKNNRKLVQGIVGKNQLKGYLQKEEKLGEESQQVINEHIEDPWESKHNLIFKQWMGKEIFPLESRVSKPAVMVNGLDIKPSKEVREWVLIHAGARPADRDPVDTRIITMVRERKGSIPASQEDVGGWPELTENHRKLSVPENPNGDDDGDGYTNLEEWLHRYADSVGMKK